MANDYNILADYIVSRYIERIAGDDIEETFVDESPADRVMVGMLAENRMEESFRCYSCDSQGTVVLYGRAGL